MNLTVLVIIGLAIVVIAFLLGKRNGERRDAPVQHQTPPQPEQPVDVPYAERGAGSGIGSTVVTGLAAGAAGFVAGELLSDWENRNDEQRAAEERLDEDERAEGYDERRDDGSGDFSNDDSFGFDDNGGFGGDDSGFDL
ncbi:MAG: hypothetical protein ABF868_05255 [Sporolactobacillus sp.]